MVTPVFHAHVDRVGHLHLADRSGLRRWLRSLAGDAVELIVRHPRRQRSSQQNRWWWGVAIPLLAEHTGYDRVSLHYELVRKCFGVTHDPKTGLDVPNARSSKLTTKEFSELMEWVIAFAACELDVTLPLPGDADCPGDNAGATESDGGPVAQFDAEAEAIASLAADTAVSLTNGKPSEARPCAVAD
jgi:hypothetical protein